MDSGLVLQGLTLVVSVGAAVTVAVVVGRSKGTRQAEELSDAATQRLVRAQGERLAILEKQHHEDQERIGRLEARVAELEEELRLERAITARLRTASAT